MSNEEISEGVILGIGGYILAIFDSGWFILLVVPIITGFLGVVGRKIAERIWKRFFNKKNKQSEKITQHNAPINSELNNDRIGSSQ